MRWFSYPKPLAFFLLFFLAFPGVLFVCFFVNVFVIHLFHFFFFCIFSPVTNKRFVLSQYLGGIKRNSTDHIVEAEAMSMSYGIKFSPELNKNTGALVGWTLRLLECTSYNLHTVIQWKFWRAQNSFGNMACQLLPQHFSFSQTSTCVSITISFQAPDFYCVIVDEGTSQVSCSA